MISFANLLTLHSDIQTFAEYTVAPYVGAWIETTAVTTYQLPCTSHPTWVRGLKHVSKDQLHVPIQSHPTWVRGLKPVTQTKAQEAFSRTLRGCVD